MSYNSFYKKLQQLAAREFPSLSEIPEVTWDHLISPLELTLPKLALERATAAVKALHAVSRRAAYSQALPAQPGVSNVETKHESVLMAYDFHTTEDGECALVEINTNASGFMFGSLMHLAHATDGTLESFAPLNDLRDAFARELKLGTGKDMQTSTPHLAITDTDIREQKMLPEFLMYRDWMQRLGWKAEFCEPEQFEWRDGHLYNAADTAPKTPVDFVYNRLTDFYFEEPQNVQLAKAFQDRSVCISPNPREYWLLADKQRLIQFTQPGFLESVGATPAEQEAIRKVMIPTYEIGDFNSHDEIWQQRRGLFFKPKRSHGGKSVYRGESVSRKVFERLMAEDILIQKFTPAQRIPTDDVRSVLTNWKFDLRCFVYADRIQLSIARIYQGQVTNFASPLGGFTLVRF